MACHNLSSFSTCNTDQHITNLHVYTTQHNMMSKLVRKGKHSPQEPAGGTHTFWAGTQLSSDRTCGPGSCCQSPVHPQAGCCAATAPDDSSLLLSSDNTYHFVKLCTPQCSVTAPSSNSILPIKTSCLSIPVKRFGWNLISEHQHQRLRHEFHGSPYRSIKISTVKIWSSSSK
jgi:hypothetical protein